MSGADKCYLKNKTGEKSQGMMKYLEGLEQGKDSSCEQGGQKRRPLQKTFEQRPIALFVCPEKIYSTQMEEQVQKLEAFLEYLETSRETRMEGAEKTRH